MDFNVCLIFFCSIFRVCPKIAVLTVCISLCLITQIPCRTIVFSNKIKFSFTNFHIKMPKFGFAKRVRPFYSSKL